MQRGEILGTVDRCYVIYQGQVLVAGTPDDVKKHPKVREEYLGDLDAAATTRPANVVPAPHFAGAQPERPHEHQPTYSMYRCRRNKLRAVTADIP